MKKSLLGIFVVSCFALLHSYNCFSQQNDKQQNISYALNFQKNINEKSNAIEEYYAFREANKFYILDTISPEHFEISQELADTLWLHLYNIGTLVQNSNSQNVVLSSIDSLIAYIGDELDSVKNNANFQRLKKHQEIFIKNSELKPKYEYARKAIQESSIDLSNGFSFTYKNEKYFAFIADLDYQDINTFYNLPDSKDQKEEKHTTFSGLMKTLDKDSILPLMITNAGMYTPKYEPEGLLISNGKEIGKIDLGKSNNLNFYLLPNGIFYVIQDSLGSTKVQIEETLVFEQNRKNINGISAATQSGPMLVVNGEHHPKFTFGSNNKNSRSGVGILTNGKPVFIISEKYNTNLFDFATIFKDLFGCEEAMYLDGAISQMYIKDIKQENTIDTEKEYGGLIYITEKR